MGRERRRRGLSQCSLGAGEGRGKGCRDGKDVGARGERRDSGREGGVEESLERRARQVAPGR